MSTVSAQFRRLQEFIGRLPLFSGLSLADIEQLCRSATLTLLPPGTRFIREGDPGDSLFLVLSGKIEVSKRDGEQEVLLAVRGPGEVVGEMSLLEQWPRAASADTVEPTEVLEIGQGAFRKLLERRPALAASILRIMAGRLRSTEASLMQQEKLASLGTLAAGLAHELNNPAAAIQRSSLVLRDSFETWRQKTLDLHMLPLSAEERAELMRIENQILSGRPPRTSAVAASREEDALIDLLEELGLAEPWDLAPPLVAYGWNVARVAPLRAAFSPQVLRLGLEWLSAGLAVQQLIEEILMGSETISRIVRAVKSYAYLDQAPVKTVDITAGIEDTLMILHHKIKNGVTVNRDFAPDLPLVEAYAGELNQVWTNLIDNAVQAMEGTGVLDLRVRPAGEMVEVKIADDGPGIPPELQARIFDPFFTTKPQGVGTGLGLHIARNIVVNRHRGRMSVESRPGRTEFTVLLPRSLRREAKAAEAKG